MQVTPILLRSFGRSGSTLMMQILGSSNNVIFDKVYPYEVRHLTYLYRLVAMINKEYDSSPSWTPEDILISKEDKVGPFPYKSTSLYEKKALFEDLLKRVYNGFSIQAKKYADDLLDDGSPLYYAEKVSLDICKDVNRLIPSSRNIILFRDPRDEFLSIKSFNEKRGVSGFGWSEGETEEEFALKLCDMRKQYMKDLRFIENNEKRVFIYYEEIVKFPYDTTSKIGDWLGLRLDYDYVVSNFKNVSQHVTSKQPEQSCSRWKSEMSPKVKKVFEKNLGEELAGLGYEL